MIACMIKHAAPINPNEEPAEISRRNLIKTGFAAVACLGLPASVQAMSSTPLSKETAVFSKEEIAAALEKDFKLDQAETLRLLESAEYIPSIIRRITTPYESKPYALYRPLFVYRGLADKGQEYIEKHRAIFDAAMQKYGVESEIIAAILGMETRFGSNRGNDRVLDSLYTLAAGFPRRAGFFRNELGHFLLMCKEEKLDPKEVLGSYAGAFGTTQFIPSSFRQYAVDADKDGRRDVFDSPTDIIHSVAHYFYRYGWETGRPIANWLPSIPYTAWMKKAQKRETRDWYTLAELRRRGLKNVPEGWNDDDKVSLIVSQTALGRKVALVHHNFHVITRWNRSYNYALAASELAGMMGCDSCIVQR